MAELDFPAAPSNGQTYTPSGSSITYTYTTAKGSWEGSLSGSQYTLQDKITLTATNTTNATHYPTFVNTATGDEEIRTDTGLTYNPSTGLLTATGITAALTGTFGVALGSDAEGDTYYRNSSGNFVRLAKGTDNHVMTMNGNVPNWEAAANGTPTDITVADESSDTTCFPLFATAATGDLGPKTGSNLKFNSSTGLLTATNITAEQDSAATNTVTNVAKFTSTSTGTPATGIGVGLEFEVETAAANNEIGAVIEAVTTDVDPTNEDFDLVFKTMLSGDAATEVLRLTSGGTLTLQSAKTHNFNNAWIHNVATIRFSGTGGIARTITNGGVGISGGNIITAGGNAYFYGQSHTTKANDIELRSGSTAKLHWDDSASEWDFQGTNVKNLELKDFSETVNILGSVSGTTAIDYESGQVVTATIGGATTFTFTNPPATGKAGTFTLLVTNPTTSITWPGTVDWAGGTAPTLTTTGLDILVFTTVDGGTIWHGMVAALDSK